MSNYFFWVACGDKYINEARQSARSVRKHHKGTRLILFTSNVSTQLGVFDEIRQIDKYDANYFPLINHANRRANALMTFDNNDEVVYLDTDTYVCSELHSLFQLLDRFDLAAAHAPGRQTGKTVRPVPQSFPEFNVGVLGVRVGTYMRSVFGAWADHCYSYQNVYKNNDQPAFREVIFDSDVRFSTLPTEYNFRFAFGGQVKGKVKVLHGRNANFEKIESVVNKNQNAIRSWGKGTIK